MADPDTATEIGRLPLLEEVPRVARRRRVTGRVRIALPNRGLALKPDMYATVELPVSLG